MLLVKTKLGFSNIHGIGLFADQEIPKNTLVFEEDEFTLKISVEKYNSLDKIQKHFLDVYSYRKNNFYYLSIDNDRFMNHSETPNTFQEGTKTYSLFNIKYGDELTCNYNDICDDFKKGIRIDP